MSDRNIRDLDSISGRDLQLSQSGGESGEFGGNMEQDQAAGMVGGGPSPSDLSSAGGSSGTGGYGNSQNVAFHQGQGSAPPGLAGGRPEGRAAEPHQSRGEAFDEQQGGGRGPESISRDSDQAAADDSLIDDQGDETRDGDDAAFNAEQS